MGFARALTRENRTVTAASIWGTWPGDDVTNTAAGIPVTPSNSLQLMAVYGSVQLITNEISTLPRDYKGPEPAWLAAPTPDLDWIAWCGQLLMSWLLQGNVFLYLMFANGRLIAVVPLDPAKCRVAREGGRKVVYVNGTINPNVMHCPGLMMPGSDVGLAPVEMARQSIGLGKAAQEYGSRNFDSDLNMPGVIEIPGEMQFEKKRELAQMWRRNRSRTGKGLPGVLDKGATWKPTGVTNEQAQFLATRQFTAAEIAGQMFLLDPSDLGIAVAGTSLTYANLAQRNTRRVQVTLMPWIRRLELVVTTLTGGDFHLNVDARLRGDTRESYETLKVGLDAGFLTIADVREILNLPPLDLNDSASYRELAEAVQKIYLGVGVVLTAEEAREILNRAGANLDPKVDPSPPAAAATPIGGAEDDAA